MELGVIIVVAVLLVAYLDCEFRRLRALIKKTHPGNTDAVRCDITADPPQPLNP